MSKKPETVFREKFDKFVDKLRHCKSFSIQQRSIVGSPDKILCISGYFVACEIKAETGSPSPMQEYHLDGVEKEGLGVALVVDPRNFEVVKRILKELDELGDWQVPNKLTRPWRTLWKKPTSASKRKS